MVTAWIDASAGIAGDMLLGALVDAGAELGAIQAAVDAVVGDSVRLSARQVERGGQRATKVEVELLVDDPPHRPWATIRRLLSEAALDERTASLALATMTELARAEGRVHGIDPEQVHFHEVGALDSIADVVGCCEAWRQLEVTTGVGSRVAVGAGRVRVAHGVMPVPVPAVAELSLGWPTEAGLIPAAGHHHHGATHGSEHADDHSDGHGQPPALPGELATPTGMALIRTLCQQSGSQPAMTVTAIGVGAGTKDFPGRPNVVRVLIGTPEQTPEASEELVHQLQANVDDLDPRLWPGVIDAVLQAGARDVWLTPIVMKKGRPAHTVHALVTADLVDAVCQQLFTSTTTLGVRSVAMTRVVLDRQWRSVNLESGPVRIKLGLRDGVIVQATPEFGDVVARAQETGLDPRVVAAAATTAAGVAGLVVGARLPW